MKAVPALVGRGFPYLDAYWQAYHVWMVTDENQSWQEIIFQASDAVSDTLERRELPNLDESCSCIGWPRLSISGCILAGLSRLDGHGRKSVMAGDNLSSFRRCLRHTRRKRRSEVTSPEESNSARPRRSGTNDRAKRMGSRTL